MTHRRASAGRSRARARKKHRATHSELPPHSANPRRVAFEALLRVERDQAYADRVLHALFQRHALDERDRGLCTELVFGSLRHQIHLDAIVARLVDRPRQSIQPPVLCALRLGAYQLLHTRILRHAAVNETVALLDGPSKHAVGFVNAVLRNLTRQLDAGTLPHFAELEPIDRLATVGSHPGWLLRELDSRIGFDATAAFVAANNQPPPMMLRCNILRSSREELAEALRNRGIRVDLPTNPPAGLIAEGHGPPDQTPEFTEGAYSIQDFAAQLVSGIAPLTDVRAILDACAAPGGKTCHLAELTADQVPILAVDRHPGRSRLVTQSAARLGLHSVTACVADAAEPEQLREVCAKHLDAPVNLAFVDAPCSGLGTLRRHPELRNTRAELPDRLADEQLRLLRSVASQLSPGGHLVYSICTVTRAESLGVIERFLEDNREFEASFPARPELLNFLDPESSHPAFRTWPHRDAMDGFFALCLKRTA